jgi:hypothetical protein|tara:strand:- start:1369 stop:1626 length:258 start_codon:yes stop_codon:yes gene_type:complete
MPSPSGVFVGLTLVELAEIKAGALDRVANGETTSLSGAGKSKGKSWSMTARDVLKEVQFAIDQSSGGALNISHFDASGQFARRLR